MDLKRKKYLQLMDIPVWEEKSRSPYPSVSKGSEVVNLLKQCEDEAKQCTRCELCKTRKKVVFGTGDSGARLMLVGEAPGATEDEQGLPFVGRAGRLLNEMLKAVGFKREDVYITNVLKCRPPNNREPLPREVACCTPFLKRQIEVIQPVLMVAVGRVAAQFLLNTSDSLGHLRHPIHVYGDTQVPLIVTYHPAYLLRSPKEKSKAYEDWLKIRKELQNRMAAESV